MQEFVLEATADKFIIIQKYKDAIQRPNYDENRALDMKMIQRGQQEPIKVNRRMWILDGYERHDLLGQRGIPIKYEFRDFPTEEDEYDYVVETNVMRRQLNNFQRIETMFNRYQTKKHRNTNDYRKTYVDIIKAIKMGNVDVESISVSTNKELVTIRNNLVTMINDYYLSRKEEIGKRNNKKFVYSLMPKAEELLSKKPNIVTTDYIGGIVGCKRFDVDKALHILNSDNEEIKNQLRNGMIKISSAFNMLKSVPINRVGEKRVDYWGKRANIECPQCHHTAPKKDFIIK